MAWFLGALGVYLLILVVVAWLSLHPIRIPIFLSPGVMGAPQEDVEVGGETGLRGWWVRAEGDGAVAVLAHGYLMNRAELAPVAYALWKRGVSSLLLDLRAHGRSGGKKSTMGLLERHDVVAGVAWARARRPGAKIILIGSSMGSAASALAMGENPGLADVLVLDSCYSRLSSAILGWWRFLGGKALMAFLAPSVVVAIPFAGIQPFRVDVAKSLQRLEGVPVLHLHGAKDDLALPGECRRNYEACPGPKALVWFEGCGHSEGRWEQPERYFAGLFGFGAERDNGEGVQVFGRSGVQASGSSGGPDPEDHNTRTPEDLNT